MCLFSIIIPVYNKERYLKNIIQDIKNQTFKDFECIVIDDGSTDNSKNILKENIVNDKRFKLISISNHGVSFARNLGLDISQGKYVTFIDSDDRIGNNYLLDAANIIKNHSDVEFVLSGGYTSWDVSNQKIKRNKVPFVGVKYFKDILGNFAKVQKKTGIYGFCWGKFILKDCISSARFDEQIKLAEDFDFYLKIYPKINKLYFWDGAPYYYLQNADNSSTQVSDYDIEYYTQLLINLRYIEFLKNMSVYNGINKQIVDELVVNYMYFSFFYCKKNEIKNMVHKLKDVNYTVNFNKLKDKNYLIKIITLKIITSKFSFLMIFLLRIYRKYKKINQ